MRQALEAVYDRLAGIEAKFTDEEGKNIQFQPRHGAMWDYFENKNLRTRP